MVEEWSDPMIRASSISFSLELNIWTEDFGCGVFALRVPEVPLMAGRRPVARTSRIRPESSQKTPRDAQC